MKQMMRVAAVGIAGMMVLSAAGADAYIETDGTQYVNTGYFVNPKTKVEMDYALLDTTRAQQRMFGTGGQDITKDFAGKVYLIHYVNGSLGYSLALTQEGMGNTWWGVPASGQCYVTRDRVTIVADAPRKTASLSRNGVVVASRTNLKAITMTALYPLTIFATCHSTDASAITTDPPGKIRLYSFRIYEDDSLVMELLPHKEGTTYCLKDTVTGRLFYSEKGNPLSGGGLGPDDSDTVVIAPGFNVTTNGPQVVGAKNVQGRSARARISCSAPARSATTGRTAGCGAAR